MDLGDEAFDKAVWSYSLVERVRPRQSTAIAYAYSISLPSVKASGISGNETQ